eukprot:34817-Chlamydomonas_euryale.AAC.1
MVQRAGLGAADGRCKVLDADADGYARAEAARALWMAPITHTTAVSAATSAATPPLGAAGPWSSEGGALLAAAGARPLAVLLSSVVNANGGGSGLTAPHGPTQRTLLADALVAAGVAPDEMAGLLLHANGARE